MKNQTQIGRKSSILRAAPQHGRRRKHNASSKPKTIRVKLWADKELVELIDRGAKKCGTSRSGFIRQAIEEILPRLEAAGR
jgi:hypothetical protein